MPMKINLQYTGVGMISLAAALSNDVIEPSKENCQKYQEGRPSKMTIFAPNIKPGRLAVLFTHKYCYLAIESSKRFAVTVTC